MSRLSQSNPQSLASILFEAEERAAREDLPKGSMLTKPAQTASSTKFLNFDDFITIKSKEIQGENKMSELKEHVLGLRVPEVTVKQIEMETRGQSSNENWIRARCGRLTASNFHAVKTKMETLGAETCRSKDTTPLVVKLMGYNPLRADIPALKYGRENEPRAIDAYIEYQLGKGHINQVVSSCGLFVSKEHAFLAASPDGLTSCACCGEGIVEAKCPFSLQNAENVLSAECLTQDEDGNSFLKKNHQYFSQIQGQLAIVGVRYCDFVIYSSKDIHVERIYFDRDYWNMMKELLCRFYIEYLLPECVTHVNRPASQIEAVRQTFNRANFTGESKIEIPEIGSCVTLD